MLEREKRSRNAAQPKERASVSVLQRSEISTENRTIDRLSSTCVTGLISSTGVYVSNVEAPAADSKTSPDRDSAGSSRAGASRKPSTAGGDGGEKDCL